MSLLMIPRLISCRIYIYGLTPPLIYVLLLWNIMMSGRRKICFWQIDIISHFFCLALVSRQQNPKHDSMCNWKWPNKEKKIICDDLAECSILYLSPTSPLQQHWCNSWVLVVSNIALHRLRPVNRFSAKRSISGAKFQTRSLQTIQF